MSQAINNYDDNNKNKKETLHCILHSFPYLIIAKMLWGKYCYLYSIFRLRNRGLE